MAKVKKLGRRPTILWESVASLWKNKTNKEISTALGTSYTNVFLKRKKLIAEAQKANKSVDKYTCDKAPWSRCEKPNKTEKQAGPAV